MLDVHIDHKAYESEGRHQVVLQDLSLQLEAGQVGAVLGPSGCGKSTLLRIIIGLDQHFEGHVNVGGRTHNGVNPDCAIMFQDHRLLPWLRVEDNVRLAFERGRASKTNGTDARKKSREMLELVELKGKERLWPKELSGGMAQRVALARALVHMPRLLLLDEPFSALPDDHRRDLHGVLMRAVEKTGVTVVMVTHDAAEALALADVVFELSPPPTHVAKRRDNPTSERQPYRSGSLDALRTSKDQLGGLQDVR